MTSDPLAWLRPFWRQLTHDPAFRMRSPESQFAALTAAANAAHPRAAALMPEYNATTVHALLRHLDANVDTDAAAGAPLKLWSATLRERTLVCEALHLPTGIDLRLMEGGDFRRTHLVRTAPEAAAKAADWRAQLEVHGWLISAQPPLTTG